MSSKQSRTDNLKIKEARKQGTGKAPGTWGYEVRNCLNVLVSPWQTPVSNTMVTTTVDNRYLHGTDLTQALS
jgi:hypothetical protein